MGKTPLGPTLGAAFLASIALDAQAPGVGDARSGTMAASHVEQVAPKEGAAPEHRATLRTSPETPHYPAWLTSPDPARRHAALEANAVAWDLRVLPLLERLEDDPDPALGRRASVLVRRYLIWGPVAPTWRERRDANAPGFEPWDRTGLRAWRARGRVRNRDGERGRGLESAFTR